ncbi:YezD family protein [Halalkalibacter alkalisediminis]|uniref:YezD family protein n=1 Tax=Halalkalibacter alkalisediminis TaxID=935616 RepID=A0ABV6NDN3_9BACI|nr:YezD family protein [Halalkalibacter alkalisediminis]
MDQNFEAKVTEIVHALKDLEYGTIVITVHDSQITQIDITEKKRFGTQKKNIVTNQGKFKRQ